MSISGYLNLGTSLSGNTVTPPPSGANYLPQPIVFNAVPGGVALSGVSCVYGPVSGSWGTLTCFSVTDASGNVYQAGTLQNPFTPANGQLVTVPQGQITLVLGSQFNAVPGSIVTSTPQKGPTTSGSVSLVSGSYTQVMASGARNMILLTNTDAASGMQVILGSSQPASGATGWSPIPAAGTWPPPSMANFVPTDAVWAIGRNGQVLNYITG